MNLLSRLIIGPRRIWWFLTDHKTFIDFRWQCYHCDQELHLHGKGFRILAVKKHNPICIYAPYFNMEFHRGWRLCWRCWKRILTFKRRWMMYRWGFRLKYNWGMQ